MFMYMSKIDQEHERLHRTNSTNFVRCGPIHYYNLGLTTTQVHSTRGCGYKYGRLVSHDLGVV